MVEVEAQAYLQKTYVSYSSSLTQTVCFFSFLSPIFWRVPNKGNSSIIEQKKSRNLL
jgi:hypothetical protein